MNLAQRAWEDNQIGRLTELLEMHRPKPGEEDLRGFEWYYWHRLSDWALLTLRGQGGSVLSVAFSPDGKRLVTTSDIGIPARSDPTLTLWDAHTGKQMLNLKAQEDVLSVAFSPDGKRLASGSFSGAVDVWDAASGEKGLTRVCHA
jgi:WD40 repeat protein